MANLLDDYQMIQQAAEASRRAEEVDDWVSEKVTNTYVRLMAGYEGCRFRNPWTD